MRFLVLLLFAGTLSAEPLKLPKVDTGWWARAHWVAAAYDSSSTGLMVAVCRTCYEANPVARWDLGRRPGAGRLAMDWALESAGVSLIPNKKVRRVAQIALIGSHLYCGSRNFARWH
jgi:hypothetical protein